MIRDRLPKIGGGIFLFCALLFLIFSPPKPNFSIANFYGFLVCFVCGILLLAGFLGTHPIAARLRREAVNAAVHRNGPLCPVREQEFSYVSSAKKGWVVAVICTLLGLLLGCLGIFMSWVLGVVAGLPPIAAGLLLIWISIRYQRVHLTTTPQGITLYGYFRTVTIAWQDIVALIAREHFVFAAGGFIPSGTVYSLYSQDKKLSFSIQLCESNRLAELISAATGLRWK